MRSGQAPAWLLVSGRSVRGGSGVKRGFACTSTTAFPPVNYRLGHRLPLARVVLLLYHAGSEPDLVLVPLTTFLFPDWRLPSARWRWVVVGAVTLALADVTASRRHQAPMRDRGDRDADPPGSDAEAGLTVW